jgi:type IV pilus assembly protein PilA
MIARVRKSMDEKDKGFTLIELLVVIIIIGILAAIAIPVFLNQRKKAVDASMKSDLRTVATNLETYLTDNNGYPAALATLTDLKTSTGNTFTYKLNTAKDGYCVIADRASGAQPGTGKWLYDSTAGGLNNTKDAACSF